MQLHYQKHYVVAFPLAQLVWIDLWENLKTRPQAV